MVMRYVALSWAVSVVLVALLSIRLIIFGLETIDSILFVFAVISFLMHFVLMQVLVKRYRLFLGKFPGSKAVT